MLQQQLNQYFSTTWQSNLQQYRYSGFSLVNKIKSEELVVDVGCGNNEFKKYLPYLVGIDPANPAADFRVTIENFRKDIKFDVALCLGSINFGDENTILNQISHVAACLKPESRIYWRCNPGLADHDNLECQSLNFYPWTFDKHYEFSGRFGYKVQCLEWDVNNRIYAEWVRQHNI